MLKYTPMSDRIIVQRIMPAETSDGGIFLPERSQKWEREATVVAVGPGRVTEYGKIIEPRVKPGDRVLILKGRGTEITHEGEKALVVSAGDILCTVDETAG